MRHFLDRSFSDSVFLGWAVLDKSSRLFGQIIGQFVVAFRQDIQSGPGQDLEMIFGDFRQIEGQGGVFFRSLCRNFD